MTQAHIQAAILGLLEAPPPGLPLTAEAAHHVISEVWAREHAFDDQEERRRRQSEPTLKIPSSKLDGLLHWLENEIDDRDFCNATLDLAFIVMDFRIDDRMVKIYRRFNGGFTPGHQGAKLVERFYSEIIEKKYREAKGGVANRGPGR